MKIKLVQVTSSMIFGLFIYYGYWNIISGINPIFLIILVSVSLILLLINLVLIKRCQYKFYTIIIFVILGFVLPLFIIFSKMNSIKSDKVSRRYIQENYSK